MKINIIIIIHEFYYEITSDLLINDTTFDIFLYLICFVKMQSCECYEAGNYVISSTFIIFIFVYINIIILIYLSNLYCGIVTI